MIVKEYQQHPFQIATSIAFSAPIRQRGKTSAAKQGRSRNVDEHTSMMYAAEWRFDFAAATRDTLRAFYILEAQCHGPHTNADAAPPAVVVASLGCVVSSSRSYPSRADRKITTEKMMTSSTKQSGYVERKLSNQYQYSPSRRPWPIECKPIFLDCADTVISPMWSRFVRSHQMYRVLFLITGLLLDDFQPVSSFLSQFHQVAFRSYF